MGFIRRSGAVLAVLTLMWGVTPIPLAGAVYCGTDTWADDYDWDDNYWVGWDYYDGSPSCDLNGNYTLGIQRINWGLGYRWSGIDGQYWYNTQTDVRNFQQARSLSADGLVGWATWDAYFAELDPLWWNGAMWIHGAPGYVSGDRNQYFGLDTANTPDRWMTYNKAKTTWANFSTGGPTP